MTNKVFLDTSFAIALAVKSDAHHPRAVELAEQLETNRTPMITTAAILLEIGNALSKQRFRRAAVELLTALEQDALVQIVPLAADLYRQAFDLFSKRPDKDWGLIDCLSFVVMHEHNLTEALTADEHFEQAGFRPLLRLT